MKTEWVRHAASASDLRQAYRSLRSSPGLTLVTLATLTVAVALSTTVFTLINGFLFHPLPYRNAERMARLTTFHAPNWAIEQLRSSTSPFDAVALYRETSSLMVYGGHVAEVQICRIDGLLLPTLGAVPLLGALPNPVDVDAGVSLALISENLWQSQFGGDSGVIGRTVEVDGAPHRVIGVMPRTFTFEHRSEVWIPLTGSAQGEDDPPGFALVRLRPNTDRVEADKFLALASERIRRADSSRFGRFRFYLGPDMIDRGRDRPTAWALVRLFLGSAACVVLIVCTNLASLLLARGAKRRGETAIMAALGATSARIAYQLVLEGLLLATIAAVAGLLLSTWWVRLVLKLLPLGATLPGWVSFEVDLHVGLFTSGLAFIAVLLFGIWPARIAARVDLTDVLQSANRSLVGADPSHRVGVPIIAQVATSLVLVVGAVVFAASYSEQMSFTPGFDTSDLYRVRITAPSIPRSPRGNWDFYSRSAAELMHSGSIEAVAFASSRVNSVTNRVDNEVYLPSGRRVMNEQNWRGAYVTSDDYFEALGLKILAGRSLHSIDAASDVLSAVVSKRFAAIVWHDENPIGKQLLVGTDRRRVEVIGLSEDRRALGSKGDVTTIVDLPEIRLSARQAGRLQEPEFLLRSTLSVAEVRQVVQRIAMGLGPELPVSVALVDTEERRKTILARSIAQLLTALAVFGVCLSLIGIYGVVSLRVEQRTREIAVRIAFGAKPSEVLTEVVRRPIRLVASGLAAGLTCLGVVTPVFRGLVIGEFRTYVLASAAACMLFAFAGLLACLIPARKATSLNPSAALRA